MSHTSHTSYRLLPIVLPVLFTMIFGSYIFTYWSGLAAAESDKEVKKEVQDQAKEIKRDLNGRLDRMEQRTIDALKKIQEAIERNGPRQPNR